MWNFGSFALEQPKMRNMDPPVGGEDDLGDPLNVKLVRRVHEKHATKALGMTSA